jgi:hypothetical protein
MVKIMFWTVLKNADKASDSKNKETSVLDHQYFMRFDVLMTVKMWIVVFWVMTGCSLVSGYHCFRGTYPPDKSLLILCRWSDMFLQNVGNHLQKYTALEPRGPQSASLLIEFCTSLPTGII